MNFIFKKNNKNLLKFWGAMYLIVIIVFGIIYWKIANKSSGQFFIFQSDINMNIKINVFEKEMKLNTHSNQLNDIIRDLIVSEEYKRPVMKLGEERSKRINIFAFDKVLGELWANYYYEIFTQKGITHMKIDEASEEMINNTKVYKVKVSFYSLNKETNFDKYKLYKYSYLNYFKKICTANIFIKDYPLIEGIFDPNFTLYPLNFYFNYIVENSISFLDDSPIVLKKIANGTFKYPLWNFFYFSTVTITTLGYGDILPNCTLVRTLVMIEAIIGVVIIGMVVSYLFKIIDNG